MRKFLLFCSIILIVLLGVVACGRPDSGKPVREQQTTTNSKNEASATKTQENIKKYVALAKQYDKKPGRENEIESLKWWTKAAELGDAEAQYTVGLIYFTGVGTEQNLKTAQAWFLKSAEQGHKDAQYHAGVIYDENLNNGNKAFEWYYKAAQQGHREAQLNLGQCYADGRGVKKDAEEAFKWYKKSAEQGDPFAQMYLADCYYKGFGITKDKNKAIEWYEKAAKQEDTAELAKIELEEIKKEN